MPDNIPVEAREMIRQFQEDEARKAAEKAAKRISPDSPREIKIVPMRNITAREMIARARDAGCEIVSGGKHGTHIKGPDGREISLPVHGGGVTLATGTARSIDGWLSQYRATGVAPARTTNPASPVPAQVLTRSRGK